MHNMVKIETATSGFSPVSHKKESSPILMFDMNCS